MWPIPTIYSTELSIKWQENVWKKKSSIAIKVLLMRVLEQETEHTHHRPPSFCPVLRGKSGGATQGCFSSSREHILLNAPAVDHAEGLSSLPLLTPSMIWLMIWFMIHDLIQYPSLSYQFSAPQGKLTDPELGA